jgi:hypothetical protein
MEGVMKRLNSSNQTGFLNPGPPKGIGKIFSLTVRQRNQEASACLRIVDELSVPGREIYFSL